MNRETAMPLYLGILPPVDDWGSLPAWAVARARAVDDLARETMDLLWQQAQREARKHGGGEGDLKSGPYALTMTAPRFLSPEVEDLTVVVGVAWKQMNNGTCFVLSLLPLATLGEVIHLHGSLALFSDLYSMALKERPPEDEQEAPEPDRTSPLN